MELRVGGRSLLEPSQARDAIVRLSEHELPEQSDGDEEHRGADERDQELRANRDRQTGDGADERIVDAAQRPPLVGDGRSPLVSRCVGHGFARLELGRAADEVRDQPLRRSARRPHRRP